MLGGGPAVVLEDVVSLFDHNRRRDERWADHELQTAMRWAFREACVGAAVSLAVDAPISGTSVRTPEVTHVDPGPPARLTVRMLPGQLPEHLSRVGRLIAPHLGGVALRVQDRGFGWAIVTVLTVDPLTGTVPRPPPAASALHPLMVGRGEDGRQLAVELGSAAHLIIQGASGSGKSVECYSLLGQLAQAPDVRVTGSDITGLLLAPWATHGRHAGQQVLGTARPVEHVALLERLVREMDQAIAQIPPGQDTVTLGAAVPVTVVVIEEAPGLFRLLKAADPKLLARAKLALARLLGEGRKAGFRVLIITQRADAEIVGAYERSQASHKITFRVDTLDGVKMLHPDATADTAAEHANASPGIGLMSAPGLPLTRLRAPYTTYAEYCATVTAGSVAA